MADYKDLLRKANEALAMANAKKQGQTNEDRKAMVAMFGQDLIDAIKPAIQALQLTKEDLKDALKNVKITAPIEQPDVIVNVPKIDVPEANISVNVPDINVPTPIVNYTPPAINIPKTEWPKDPMQIEGWVNLMGVSLEKPLPVQLRDASGRPVNLLENLTTIINGGGSGGFRHVIVDKMPSLSVSSTSDSSVSLVNADGTYYNSDNPLPITGTISTTPAPQVSGYADSVNVMQYGGTNVPTGLNETTAGVFRTVQMTDSVSSVNVVNTSIPVTTTQSIEVKQVSGSTDSVNITNASLAVTQSGTWDEVGINDSGNSITIDTTQSFEVKQVSGFTDSVFVTGFADSSVVYEVYTTNKTAKSDGADVRPKADDLGRQLTRPIQVRDLIVTAYVSVTSGTETTLLAASAGSFHDLIMLVGSNNSDAAVSVDIRAVTAGNVINTLRIPANGTAGFVPTVPWPQDETGNNWTVDGPDETGRTLTFSALFSREV